MNVDFNHIRRVALASYADLVNILRAHMDESGDIRVRRSDVEGDCRTTACRTTACHDSYTKS